MTQRNKDAIAWLRFPLIFFVILLHAYSVVQIPGEHAVFFKTAYPLSLWIGETGVPGFFFISGFLFFLSKKKYGEKLQSRFHTLLVPYIIWNTLLLAAYVAAYALGHPQDINGRNMADYGWTDYVRLFWDRGSFDNGNFVPLLCPYWYIRNLLLLSVVSPLIFVLVRYVRELFLLGMAMWWMFTPHNAFIQQSVFFFSLGAYFSINERVPLIMFSQKKKLAIGLCIVLGLADIITHVAFPTPFNLQIHRMALIANIPALFLLADYCVRHGFQSPLLTGAAFIVFSIHYPLIVVMRKGCAHYFAQANDAVQFALYLGCVVAVTALSLLFYQLLPHSLRNLLSGNRS